MAPKKKSQKKKKNVNTKSISSPPVITEDQKEFYTEKINLLESRLIKYV